jgi:hypothetical protein
MENSFGKVLGRNITNGKEGKEYFSFDPVHAHTGLGKRGSRTERAQ